MADFTSAPYTGAAVDVQQVAAGAGASFAALTYRYPLCGIIVLHSAGILAYTDRRGTNRTLPIALPAGAYPIEAQAILAATTADVTCLFFSGTQ